MKTQRSTRRQKGMGAQGAVLVLALSGVSHAQQVEDSSDPAPAAESTISEAEANSLPPDRVVHVATASPRTEAEEPEPDPPNPDKSFVENLLPETHGFVSQGFLFSTDNNYIANSTRGSFEFTEVGINFTKQLTDRLRAGMQLFMRDYGPEGNYKPQFDWFYLDYRFFDWLGIRAGRSKIPFGLYNEINDADQARVPILLPQSVYPVDQRTTLMAQTGGEIYGDIPLGPAGSLEYRAYGGTLYADLSGDETVKNFDVPFVVGGRAMWQTPLDGLRLGASVQSLRIEWDSVIKDSDLALLKMYGLVAPDADNLMAVDFPITRWVASVEYSAHEMLLAAEYSQWSADLYSDMPAVFPALAVTNERFYVMASFRAASWFSPGVYYAYLTPSIAHRSTNPNPDSERHDLAVTARYDINDYWLVKLEAHYLHGTADLDEKLNGGTPRAQLAPDWGLFLLKTTAYF